MIYYMPFTHISDTCASELAQVLDKLAVFQPVANQTSENMRSWEQRGFLELRKPTDLDENHLNRILADFKHWSDSHQSRIGDLSGYFKTGQNQTPMLDEASPNRIRTQIQRYQRSTVRSEDDRTLQAALFLSMAQEYDANQDSITQELGSILKIEKAMAAQLAGREQDMREALQTSRSAVSSTVMKDPGTYMTPERIRSWAAMALADAGPIHALVTTSPAVWEHLRDILPEPSSLFTCDIVSNHDPVEQAGTELRQQICRTFQDIAFDNDPVSVSMDAFSRLKSDGGLRRLTLYTLAGCPLAETLSNLIQPEQRDARAERHIDWAPNTVIGFFETRKLD